MFNVLVIVLYKIVFGIVLFVILYFACSVGKYDSIRTNTFEIVK